MADTARSDTIQCAQEPMICQEEDFERMIPDPEIGKRLKEILERLVRSAYPAVVNAGADYTLMIACSGTPYSWGMSRRGALGQDLCITSNASPQQLIKTFRERIVSVNAGTAHSLVLTEVSPTARRQSWSTDASILPLTPS